MPRETMTPRERWEAVLRRETPDRVPMDIWWTPEARANLLQFMNCDEKEALARLHIDTPWGAAGIYTGPATQGDGDMWGLRYEKIAHANGAYVEVANAPLARFESVEEIEREYRWPVADDWDYSQLPAAAAAQANRPIRGGGSEPFMLFAQLRGDEQAYMDLVENPELVDYCLDKLFDLAYEDTRRILEAIPGQVLFSYVSEDLGGQSGLLISRAHMERYLFPRMQRMMDLVHSAGAHVMTHSDGAIRPVLPDLVRLGTDILNPIQWRLPGMEREALKQDFGGDFIFHGAVDNQSTLPFGSVADVEREVAENLQILGQGGGYILAPCHNLQGNTPPENMVALYETGYQLGWR